MTQRSQGLDTLLEMLRYMRPHGSNAEHHFIERFITPLGMERDTFGNLFKRVGKSSRVLWSCHTDTVHRRSGQQAIAVSDDGFVRLKDKSKSNCLGADDTAGIWIMREMIMHGVPGLYVFHRAEEIGGLGSSHIVEHAPNMLDGINYAIAFDRRGTSDVITHQASGMSCSDAFAQSLCEQLGMAYAPCDTGIFTDTANYADHVAECSNVSVGYTGEHTFNENLDLAHVMALADAMMAFDERKLVVERAPGDYGYQPCNEYFFGARDGYHDRPRVRLLDLVRDYPDEIVDLLEDYGMTAESVQDEIWQRHGMARHKRYYLS